MKKKKEGKKKKKIIENIIQFSKFLSLSLSLTLLLSLLKNMILLWFYFLILLYIFFFSGKINPASSPMSDDFLLFSPSSSHTSLIRPFFFPYFSFTDKLSTCFRSKRSKKKKTRIINKINFRGLHEKYKYTYIHCTNKILFVYML